MTCPTCGASVAEGARYCSACGHPMASRGDERRVVTVVFADLVGFTSLAEARDPEQVKNLVDGCFEQLGDEVTAFGGRVDNIIGDAIVALFGAPLAHEDDAERAVRAGLRMQERLRAFSRDSGIDVQLRVGVNTGEVLVGSLRAAASYTAMGDVVNTADRLQKAATPGSVVVGPATYAATREVIDYEPLGSIGVKGREETVDAWIARAPLLPPGYRPRRMQTPFVGRDPELGVLRNAIDVAFDRGRAHLVLLLGEAGVGKSRLAEEVAEWARREQRGAVLEGRCVPYGEANVWWPVAEALREACGVSADDPLGIAHELCTEVVALSVDLPAESDEVARIVQGLLYLMGYEVPLREIDPQRAREEATRSVLAFIEGTALSRPVVVVLSDLHWADDLVLEMIDVLMERLSRARVVVMATARPELQRRWTVPTGRHNSILVNLDPLDRASTALLLESLAEADLDQTMRAALLDRSGGNPFFLEELVALVAPSDAVGAGSPTAGAAELPDTLRGLVAARIDGLTDVERATVQDAAVWGRRGPVVALERMAEQIRGLRQLGPVLEGLVDKDILVVDGPRWSFRSDLIREVSYGTLTKADRARRHHGIATFLEHNMGERDEASERLVDVIAHHYAATAELVDDIGTVEDVPADVRGIALDWLEEAARRAEVGQVPLVAERLFTQAVDLLSAEPGARRVRALLGLARAETGLRHLDAAESHLALARREAEALGAEDLALAGRVVLGDLHQKRGDFPASVTTLLDAAEALEARGDAAGAAEALRFAGMSQIFMGELADAEASIDRALDLYRRLGDVRGAAWALQNLAWISYVEGRTDEAEDRVTASAETFRELGDTGGTSWAMGLLGFVRFHQGRLAEAEELGERALREGRERGDRWGEGMMLLLTAGVRLWSGRAGQAVAAAREALEVFRSIEDAFGTLQAAATYGRTLVTAGEVEVGLDFLREELGRPAMAPTPEQPGVLALSLACSLTQIGEPDEALAAMAEFSPVGPTGEDAIVVPERIAAEGLALVQAGRADAGRVLLESVVDDRGELPPYPGSALVVALASVGDTEAAMALADRVAAGPRATYLDVATAETAAALVRARSGDEDALTAFADLIASLDATEDRVSRAVVRLAEAMALDALGLPSADLAMQATERMLAQLGIDARGWRTAFAAILSPRPAPHPA